MRLASYEYKNQYSWGIVISHPRRNGEDWIFNPAATEKAFGPVAGVTSGWAKTMTPLLGEKGWPDTLQAFLALGDEGMQALRRMQDRLLCILKSSDFAVVELYAHRVSEVNLLSPVPMPKLMFGLVANSPSFVRNNASRRHVNMIPQGHQRPIGAMVGHDGIFVGANGYNVELGIVIGKPGKDIPVEEAINHVAGFTTVIDSQKNSFYRHYIKAAEGMSHTEFRNLVDELRATSDWYVDATCSWGGKMCDAHCVVGPWLTTMEEFGNIYDMLVYTLQDGLVRDRSLTGASLYGVERLVHWMSTFRELQPGEILHMGTMGTDGLPVEPTMSFNRENSIGAEIEGVGYVQAHVMDEQINDWRTEEEKHPNADVAPDDPVLRDHPSYAVRYFLKEGLNNPETFEFDPKKSYNVWTCYGNYRQAGEVEGLREMLETRFLNAPATVLAVKPDTIQLAKRATSLKVSVEITATINQVASQVSREDAHKYIGGYYPSICVCDDSFRDELLDPLTPQEAGLLQVYGRWGDGYQAMGEKSETAPAKDARLSISAEGFETVTASMQDYLSQLEDVLVHISRYITMFPGDVITLGRTQAVLEVPADKADGLKVSASIEGMQPMEVVIKR